MKDKEKPKIFEGLPDCASQFIRQLIRKMRYRKKVRRDVQAELIAHFQDELKDTKTAEEKEQKAQKLISEFGDLKLLAVLMRRAKKRCRPLWLKALAKSLQATSVLAVCLILYIIWFLSGEPNITIDYIAELNQLVRPAAEESLNAAPFYQKAMEMFKEIPDDISYPSGSRYDEVNDKEKQLIRKWLADNAEMFELIIAASEKPYYWHNYVTKQGTGKMISSIDPSLSKFRRLAFTLRWRVWLAIEDGRYEQALSNIKALYRLGQHLRGDKILVEQIVGIAIEALAIKTLRGILNEHEINSAILAKLQKDLEETVVNEDFTISLKAERLSTYDQIQRTFTDGLGRGHIIPKRIEQLAEMMSIPPGPSSDDSRYYPDDYKHNWLSILLSIIRMEASKLGGHIYDAAVFIKDWSYMLFLYPDKQETRKAAEEFYDYWEIAKIKTPVEVKAEQTDIEEHALEIIKGNMFLEILRPGLDRISLQTHLSKARVEAVITIIALLRYYQDVGHYPYNLNQLITAGYLKTEPMDPYSDKSLSYKTTDDGFILYSVGPNFIDNSGMVAEVNGRPRIRGTKDQGDWVFWPVQSN